MLKRRRNSFEGYKIGTQCMEQDKEHNHSNRPLNANAIIYKSH